MTDDDLCEYCEEPDCLGDCWEEPDDDALMADADYAWHNGRAVPVETETALSEAGLL